MKWLLLLLLVSCGQEEVPKAVDLNDNDGDQIPNHLESFDSKFIANFTPIGEIKGEMKFSIDRFIKKELFLKLSNKKDLLADSLDILTKPESKLIPEDFFSEWSKIKIDVPNSLPELEDRIFDIDFSFIHKDSAADFLIMVKAEENIKLGDFTNSMHIKLNRDDLILLLSQKAHLAFGKRTMIQHYADSQPVQQTIREKTYRVFLNDESGGSILYISKDFSFDQFLSLKGISKAIDFKTINPFEYESSESQWFYRHLPFGDKVLVQTKNEQMLNSYLKNFEKSEMNLKRLNGRPVNSLKIIKNELSVVQLKIRMDQTVRTFREYQENVRHTIGGGKEGSPSVWYCANYYRVIDTEIATKVDLRQGLLDLILKIEGMEVSLSRVEHLFTEKEDEIGRYLLVTIQAPSKNLEVYLQTNSNDSFVSTGRYDLKCPKGEEVRGKISTVPTNIEGYLNLAIEAYVEKLD